MLEYPQSIWIDCTEEPARSCNIVDRDCKAPPGIAGVTRATCYACGLPTCTNPKCSKVVPYVRSMRRRLCASCQHDHKKTKD